MIINTIYSSYQGEVNIKGIGAPVIFIRTGGCHLRCYLKTLGVLCDTPEALEKGSGTEMSFQEVVERVQKISLEEGGIKLVCLSGGDPLWRSTSDIEDLLWLLGQKGFHVSVETSGTLSIREYKKYSWVSWVIDYKSKSAGVKQKFFDADLPLLNENDFIKFVIYDKEDYDEFVELFEAITTLTKARIAVGLYWGGKFTYEHLMNYLKIDKLLGKVHINFQAHKMLTMYDKSDVSEIKIPKEI